ncbi:hypothetical protein Dimus_033961 [Dionaea muscipula]
MDLIKRRNWKKLFKRRELVHVDVVKEFYARLTLSHFKKKDAARSSVRGVKIEFDHMKLASILGILGNMAFASTSRRFGKSREVVDEAVVQGESGSDDQFFDAQVDVKEPVAEAPDVPAFPASPGDSTNQQREQTPAGVDPSGPSGHISESVMIKLQAEFERARSNRIQANLEKAQDENARLSALLQQAKSPPKP